MNKKILMGGMIVAGYSQKRLSAAIGIGLSSLSAKINGHKPFKTNEIRKICDVLGITEAEKTVEIFLTDSPINGTDSD